MPKVTIDHIARETGLSRGTVSRALNDRPDIGAATRQRVLAACARLNYTPSTAARSLATGRHFTLAILVTADSRRPIDELLRAAALAAHAGRYSLQVIVIPHEDSAARIRALAADRIDGLLIQADLTPPNVALLLQTLPNRPMVSLQEIDGLSCDVVTADSREAGRLAAAALLARGAGSVIHLRELGSAPQELHRAGFADAYRAAGAGSGRVSYESLDGDSAGATLGKLLASADGVACASSAITLAVVAGRARSADRDVAIIGMGLAQASVSLAIPVTIDPLDAEIARRAVELLIQRIEPGRLDEPQVIRVAPTVINTTTTNT